jgi:adenylate cyclase
MFFLTSQLAMDWAKRGYQLGLGVGIATGYATMGRIGFEGRHDYAAIGNIVNLASRLSQAAGSGEILISQRVHAAVEDRVHTDPARELQLRGFSRPVIALQVVAIRD